MIDKNYVLVDSSYPIKKGREVVFTLLDDKINFLKKEVLNELLTEDIKDQHKKNRIKDLENVREELNTLLSFEGASPESVEVFCELKIKLK